VTNITGSPRIGADRRGAVCPARGPSGPRQPSHSVPWAAFTAWPAARPAACRAGKAAD